MDPKLLWPSLALKLHGLIFSAIHIIFIAVAFEFIAWWAGRQIDRLTAPFITADAGRPANWRIRRRTTLRQTPKIISRTLCYTIALILVFDVFGVPVLALSIGIGVVAAFIGAALLPQLRDISQGYTWLAEDTLAVGDVVDVGGHTGVVEKFTLRGLWIRDNANQSHCLSNSSSRDVLVLQKMLQESAPSEIE